MTKEKELTPEQKLDRTHILLEYLNDEGVERAYAIIQRMWLRYGENK